MIYMWIFDWTFLLIGNNTIVDIDGWDVNLLYIDRYPFSESFFDVVTLADVRIDFANIGHV